MFNFFKNKIKTIQSLTLNGEYIYIYIYNMPSLSLYKSTQTLSYYVQFTSEGLIFSEVE